MLLVVQDDFTTHDYLLCYVIILYVSYLWYSHLFPRKMLGWSDSCMFLGPF